MLRFAATGESHVGLVRDGNEDSAFAGPYCVLVADGVGGGAAGEVASATATYAVCATVLEHLGEDPAAVLAQGVARAQDQVRRGVEQDERRAGMATTLTAVVTDGTRFTLAHLGDSRGYVLHEGVLSRVTRDHTYVQDLVEEGRLSPEEVVDHPWRNVVLRTVSGHADAEPDLLDLALVVGDRVLLASDGLTDLVGDPEIERLVTGRSDADAVDALLAAALARGGKDNITCVLGTVEEGPRSRGDGELLGAVRDVANIVDPAAEGPGSSAASA